LTKTPRFLVIIAEDTPTEKYELVRAPDVYVPKIEIVKKID
jgi:hypothetical protein